MNRETFLNSREVSEFIEWMLDILPSLHVSLSVSKQGTGRGGSGVCCEVNNFSTLVDLYCWNSKWIDLDGCEVRSSDWNSTLLSQVQLQTWIKREIESVLGMDGILKAAQAVAQWGGDRNSRVGMMKFLQSLTDVRGYFREVKHLLALKEADLTKLNRIIRMNSMLTKVHALIADDGLPIYDSRVAGAIGALVEIYRQQRGLRWCEIPEALQFKAPYRETRRRVICLSAPNQTVVDPGVFPVSHLERAVQWSSAKIRLGWLIEALIQKNADRNSMLLNEECVKLDRYSQMRAIEASFFMLGFDLTCFRPMMSKRRD